MNEKKLLIVEDSAIVAMDLRHKLTKLGYTIMSNVASGEDAVVSAGAQRPDLVLMDIMLSGTMDGIEAADTIGRQYDIPVLFMSAYSDDQTIDRAKKTKNYGFLVKPFEERDLLTTIEMALERSRFDRRIRESEKKYRELFESSRDPIFIIDTDLQFIDLNNAMAELFDHKHNEMLGRPAAPFFALAEDFKAFIDELLAEGFVKDFEVPMKRKDGEIIVCQMTANARYRNGKVYSYQGAIRDITDKKLSEKQLEQSYAILQRTMFDVIQAMTLAVESRDPYTAGHQRGVAELANAIAEKLELSPDRMQGIKLAGLIHDLGKIAIPAEILSKPGRLTDTEFKLIKTHPEVGHSILKDINFPWPIKEIVVQHHERLDGSGYPKGLAGDEILMEARILTVADVVEAMASHRPYRPALGMVKAVEEIQQNKGTLYDSDVVDACVRTLEGITDISFFRHEGVLAK